MTQKLQFAEEGLKLRVESYELSKTLHWCNRLKNSIIINAFPAVGCFVITGKQLTSNIVANRL